MLLYYRHCVRQVDLLDKATGLLRAVSGLVHNMKFKMQGMIVLLLQLAIYL